MPDINVRSDAIDVEQIMRQIRARIREKRGVDYTEAELQQLANVKLEQFLDPRGVRSDLVERFRRTQSASPAPPNYEFEADTMYETHRGLVRAFRRLFRPLLKLFFNPDKITVALHLQSEINTQAEKRLRRVEERESLYYEIIHNLTLEVTRLGIEVHNLKMRVEALSGRVDFDERRARSLEGVVQYRPTPARSTPPPESNGQPPAATSGEPGEAASASTAPARTDGSNPPGAASGERRRRRRRRRRRPGQSMAERQFTPGGAPPEATEPGSEPVVDDAPDDVDEDAGPDDSSAQ